MKNYQTPRLARDGVIKGIGYTVPDWIKRAMHVFVGLVMGICIVLALTGCATATHGTKQEIDFTLPPGQVCEVMQDGQPIGTVRQAESMLVVRRMNKPVNLVCDEFVTVYRPAINKAGYTSIMFIDFGLVDYITGALWSYEQ